MNGAFLTVSDILPTILDLAGVQPHAGKFAGRDVRPIRGKSWRPLIEGASPLVHAESEPFAIELFGSRFVRKGDWKITDPGDGQWRLFNIGADPGETTDLAAAEPDKLKELEADWAAYAAEAGVVQPEGWWYRP